MTDKLYSREEIMRMEISILTVLEFKIFVPTAVHFLYQYQSMMSRSASREGSAQHLLELTLADYSMLKYSPSHVAAATLLVSNKIARIEPSWTPSAVNYTQKTDSMLRACAKQICNLLE